MNDTSKKLESIISKCSLVNSCLEWNGNYFRKKDKEKTYPYIYHKNKVWRGNRLVLFLTTNKIPKGMYALHKCDNKRCVNPDHLYWGTPKENVKDAYERKRARNAKTTHCPRGHPYSGDNLYINNGKRYCKICKKIFYAKYRKEGRYKREKI